MKRTLSILIPCYNEEATIEKLLKRVDEADYGLWDKEIIVVDDGSKDRSRAILEQYKHRPGYQIIFHEKNGGKGEAERTAILHAKGDYLILQDADLEYDPNEIKKLLRVVDTTGAPIVFGSRNLETSWHRIKEFFAISIGVWASTVFVNVLYGTKLTDAWTCYKLFSREVSKKAHFIGNGFEADYLFIGDAAAKGYPIVEVLISHAPRTVAEGKKIRYMDGVRSMTLLLFHRLSHLRSTTKDYSDTEKRLQRIAHALRCPVCGDTLSSQGEETTCIRGHVFPRIDSVVPVLAEGVVVSSHEEEHLSGVNWLKSFLKQFPGLYYFVWQLFCPALMIQNSPKRVLRYASPEGLIADIGSGPDRVADSFINVDIYPFPTVDVVATAEKLPFVSGTFDALVTESMLEHVARPMRVAEEMRRVLKEGGVVYASAPFIHPFHASPDDFNRFTTSGLKELFPGFEVLEVGVRSGPWSALLLFIAYWLGVIFSFGSKKLAPFLAHIFMLILGPFKILDFVFAKFPGVEAVSTHLYIIARKPKQKV